MIDTLHYLALGVQNAPAITSGPAGPDLTRYFVVCALLLAAIGGLAFGFKKLVASSIRTRAARRSLQVIDVLPLGGKQRLAVVRCYDRAFALGLGEREVTLVAELDPIHAEKTAGAAPESADRRDFERTLDRVRAEAESETRTNSGKRITHLFRSGGLFG